MYNPKDFNTLWKYKARAVFAVAAVIIWYRLITHAGMTGMYYPPFVFSENETWYRLLVKCHFTWLFSNHWVRLLIITADIFMAAWSLTMMVRPWRGYVIAFTLIAVLYFFAYNMATGHHFHSLVGVIVMTLPFWFKREERFNTMWELARYYWLYVFASAALWKIFRGTVFYTDQLSNILKSQQLDMLLQHPGSVQSQVVEYLIANPAVSHWVLIANVLLQLSFAIGFFTKKYDRVLFFLAIIFCMANYFVMSIISVELLILNLTLVNWEWIIKRVSHGGTEGNAELKTP